METFSIKNFFSRAWQYTKSHMTFLVVSTLIYLAIAMVLGSAGGHRGALSGILSLASNVIQVIFTIGLIKISFLIISGGSPKAEDFKTDWTIFWRMVWACIVATFFAVIGFILLIIPGIYVGIRLTLSPYFVIDKKMSGWQAVKESWRVTKDHFWKLFGLNLLLICVVIVSLIPFGLGLLLSLPFGVMVMSLVYKHLSSREFLETEKNISVVENPTIAN